MSRKSGDPKTGIPAWDREFLKTESDRDVERALPSIW